MPSSCSLLVIVPAEPLFRRLTEIATIVILSVVEVSLRVPKRGLRRFA